MSSSSDSDTSTGSSPYVSDNEVRYCKSTCQSIYNDACTDDIPGFDAVALDETERTDIATISEQGMKTAGDRFYPKKLKTYIKENEWNIYQQIMNEVTEQKGWVFAAPSILQMISQCGYQKPVGVKYDVCHCSPSKPLKVLTFITEDDSETRYVRYNARLTTMIINHIEKDIGQPLSAVYGVIDGRKHVSDEEFGKRIRVLEIAAQKTSLPQTLHVDGHIYRKMTKSLLDLFSTTNPSPQTESQEANDIPPGNYKQSKMTESITNDEKRNGADKDEKRALPTKDDTYLAMPAAPMKNKTTAWGPKREPFWTDDEIVRLQQLVVEPCKDNEGKAISLKILVFGPTGHGKSSLCNGFRSAIMRDKHPSTYHAVGGISKSVTRGFHGAIFGDHWIIDMAGIYESKNISSMNIEDIASGRVPFYAELTDTLGVYDKESIRIPSPGENDVSCVVIVLKYDEELGPELKRQIGVILDLGKQGVLSYRLVLTFLDECDPLFNDTDNLPLMYQSDKAQSVVKRMSKETGIPAYAIHFVKNYTTETETDNNTSLQHLRVLEGVIFSAHQQLEKKSDQKRKRDLYTNKVKQQDQTTSDFRSILKLTIVAVIGVLLMAVFSYSEKRFS